MQANNAGQMVVYYTQNFKKEKQILSFCRGMGVRTRKGKPGDCGMPAGLLAGMRNIKRNPDSKQAPAAYRLPEFLLFSGFSDAALDRFLEGYRSAGIEPIALKAVLTPHNCGWSLYELLEELGREHAAMAE